MKKVVRNCRVLLPWSEYLGRHPLVPPEPDLSWDYNQSLGSYLEEFNPLFSFVGTEIDPSLCLSC